MEIMKTISIKFGLLLTTLSLLLSGCDNTHIQGFAEVNDTKLFYKVSGKGTPVILIHGFSFDSRCWNDQIPALKKKYQVICYDLRGFGQSSLPALDQPYSHTRDLISLMDHLGIDKAKEIWINGSPLLPAMQNEHSATLVKKMIDDYSAWHWVNNDPHVGFEGYSVKKLKSLFVPTLIMYGSASPIGYFKIAEIQHENIPNSKLVEISNAAHALNIENSVQFNSEILEFLSEYQIK